MSHKGSPCDVCPYSGCRNNDGGKDHPACIPVLQKTGWLAADGRSYSNPYTRLAVGLPVSTAENTGERT